jgi:hypothetical protein
MDDRSRVTPVTVTTELQNLLLLPSPVRPLSFDVLGIPIPKLKLLFITAAPPLRTRDGFRSVSF